MTLTIRRATPADARALAQMRLDDKTEDQPFASDVEADFLHHSERWLADRLDGQIWLAWVATTVDGVVRGHVFLQRIEKMPSPQESPAFLGYLTSFYVAPAYRNRGVGRALLAALVAEARSEPLNTIVVWPSEQSVPLYQRMGFAIPEEILELRISD